MCFKRSETKASLQEPSRLTGAGIRHSAGGQQVLPPPGTQPSKLKSGAQPHHVQGGAGPGLRPGLPRPGLPHRPAGSARRVPRRPPGPRRRSRGEARSGGGRRGAGEPNPAPPPRGNLISLLARRAGGRGGVSGAAI